MTSGEATPATLNAIQARNYRSLKHVDLRFDGNLHVLVGPNGSGKSTLLDAIEFLFDYMNQGLKKAVGKRTRNFQDLVWGRPPQESSFELAAEFAVGDQQFRYELRVEESGDGMRVAVENGFLGHLTPDEFAQSAGSDSICVSDRRSNRRQRQVFGLGNVENVLTFGPFNEDNRSISFVRGHRGDDGSAIGFLSVLSRRVPFAGEEKWDFSNVDQIGDALTRRGVQYLQLDSRKLRQASSPDGDDDNRLADDGSNLPQVLERLHSNREEWTRWLKFVRIALPELEDVRIVHREDDRHKYLMIKHAGVEVPSWVVSEGTLRLFALTAVAHLQSHPLAYLLEEPENGIHPMAIEYAYQALSAVRGTQVFVASHSPTLLHCVELDQVLCFGLDSRRGTVIVRGDEHPQLREWQGSVDDTVFWAVDILS